MNVMSAWQESDGLLHESHSIIIDLDIDMVD